MLQNKIYQNYLGVACPLQVQAQVSPKHRLPKPSTAAQTPMALAWSLEP